MNSVLVVCEESGIVRRAFRGRGWDAWSNDLIPSADNSSRHLQMDAMNAIRSRKKWDLIIMHPPCDALALSGNRWYGKGMPMHEKRVASVEWTLRLWDLARSHADHVALENPKSVIFPILGRECDVQYVQPYQFGHPEMKETGFALYSLPRLQPTDELVVPEPGTKEYTEWQKVWRMAPSPDRKKMRSRTYLMIADAMADQWGGAVLMERNYGRVRVG